mmetsp:Transcript_4528/g.13620  ORF Transcript_4528/g.13620 Transcript_4528/m.13620 type:complete len:248 (-) Transcript_4528:268-1011(-)
MVLHESRAHGVEVRQGVSLLLSPTLVATASACSHLLGNAACIRHGAELRGVRDMRPDQLPRRTVPPKRKPLAGPPPMIAPVARPCASPFLWATMAAACAGRLCLAREAHGMRPLPRAVQGRRHSVIRDGPRQRRQGPDARSDASAWRSCGPPPQGRSGSNGSAKDSRPERSGAQQIEQRFRRRCPRGRRAVLTCQACGCKPLRRDSRSPLNWCLARCCQRVDDAPRRDLREKSAQCDVPGKGHPAVV